MRHILTFAKDLSDRLNKIAMLIFVHEIFTGQKVADIQPAPLVTEMLPYGGALSDQEYQKKIDDSNNKLEDQNFVTNCKAFFNRLILDE